MNPIRIMLVDDHLLVRIGMSTVIGHESDMTVVAQTGNAREAVTLYRNLQPDIVLMDLRLSGSSGLDAISAILSEFALARFIVISNCEGQEDIHRAMTLGAKGYIFKSVLEDQLLDAIREVYSGRQYLPEDVARRLAERQVDTDLSDREFEVLELLAKGLGNREIAIVLNVTEHTVKAHAKGIFRKFGVSNRTEAVSEAAQRGLIHLY